MTMTQWMTMRSRSGRRRLGSHSAGLLRAFCVRLGDVLLRFILRAAGVVVGLLGFVVLVDGSRAVPSEVVDLPEIDVRPDLNPFVALVQIAIQRVSECIGRGGIVLLIEECFRHAEIGERVVLLQVQRLGVLLDGVVEAALLGQCFAARDDGPHVQPVAGLEDVVVRVQDNAVRLGPSEDVKIEVGLLAGDLDGLEFRIAFGLDFEFYRHAEEVETLLYLTHDFEPALGAEYRVVHRKFRERQWSESIAQRKAADSRFRNRRSERRVRCR